ncbi:MAG: hypothetical protein M3Q66_01055 [Chloroflexota bacterium]|nr:hypothetical protein [Chloroflexota bacterium]
MASRTHSRPARLIVAAATLTLLSSIAGTAAAAPADGFKTSRPTMLDPVAAGVTTEPLISVGDIVDGYRFEAIPDGIALRTGVGGVDVWVNHETARVPFPYNPTSPTEANSQNDFDNSQLSHLVLNAATAGVLGGDLAITSASNYQRFCSNFLATSAEGFERPLLFLNEETPDWTNRTGNAWPATIGADQAREGGAVVAFDPATGEHRPIWGMGRHNHENSVAIPGFKKVVVLSGDDTFTTTPAQSQLYSYIAKDANAVWNDNGRLYGFVSDDPSHDFYDEFTPGDATSVSGKFIPIPKLIAAGRNPDGTDLMAGDVPAELGGPYPLPPADGTWQRPPGATSPGVDGPQWVLEHWSNLNGVFRFVRVEDIAYDKRPGMSNVVYVVDSGRGTAGAPAAGRSTNGRIWKMVLDPRNERKVTSLSIFIEGDDRPVKDPERVHQPDNIETTRNGIYLTEDPGSSQQFAVTSTDPAATTARVWQHRFSDGANTVIARVNQSSDETLGYDVDGDPTVVGPRGNLGAWESTGIVDASAAFGPGAFLINVQASTLWVEKAPGDDNVAPAGPDFTNKRAGGQLLLIRVPNG